MRQVTAEGPVPVVEGRRIQVRGTVQGVGFRPFVYRLAREEGVSGCVRNEARGVTIEAFGTAPALDVFLRRIETDRPPAAEVREVCAEAIPADAAPGGFEIVASRGEGERRVSIPADLATCPECQAEVHDPRDRRHGYAFTNCTHCGPRYTIARDVPYDRAATTMAGFALCGECRREYEDPADRRFHAQPVACPACGPRLRLLGPAGEELEASNPLLAAAAALRDGRIVAVKGLGGYHLACDATSSGAVRRLRERKKRDEKPFAVMVPDVAAARAAAVLDAAEEALLACVERPIVLVRRRSSSGLAAEVAPGNPLVGLLLAYTPLHVLVLEAVGRPLVMTSANLSEEPMAAKDDEALARLCGIADLFLAHDREIENRCDDSVARVIAGRPTILRRSRGYVPRAVRLATAVERPVLACGAHLKNTFCLAAGHEAFLGPHVGDLDNLEAGRAFEEQVERLQRFLGIVPEVIAHDLHPDYFSTRYARARPEAVKVAVQHHHAHVAAAAAEHGLDGPVLGLAWDGTGYGTDGTAWGGELLLVDGAAFERLATLRPLRLAGSDQAIREVWRIALAALDDAFSGAPPLDALALFDGVSARDVAVVRQMAAKSVRSPLAHGAGRWFDARGGGRATRGRSRSSGTWRRTAPRTRRPIRSSSTRRGPVPRPTCGRWCGRRSPTSSPVSRPGSSPRASTRRWPRWRWRWSVGRRGAWAVACRSCSPAGASRTRSWPRASAGAWPATSRCACTGRCRPATAESPSARRSWPTRW
jgi:hydrogenase maturation protein HypF